jgi:ubiquinone/menaquinone biosynthesis C-methylase UbiE
MKLKFLDPAFGTSLNQKFRENRFKTFTALLAKVDAGDSIKILDIGGTEIYWERMKFIDNKNIHITLLNLEEVPTKKENFTSIKGNACDLSDYADNTFDIVYSNSVIEHLFTLENQKKMADEARRVGKYYYIQTPNYYFPIEPHWLCPFYQFLPFGVRVFLTKNFNLGHHSKAATKADAIKRVEEVKLLSEKKMKKLFPDGKVLRERFFGLVKSVTMYRFPENPNITAF